MVHDTDYREILGIQAPTKTSSVGIPLKKPACNYCKRRKVRCDHKLPCNQCKKRKITCEYDGKPNTQEDTVSKLISEVDQLKSELHAQRQISEYWRNLYQEKSRIDNPIVLNITRRPMFSASTIKFSHNVINAVEKSNMAFLEFNSPLMPNTTSEYRPEYSALVWNRLVDSLPEDLAANIRSMNIGIITHMLYQSSIFALGTALLDEMELSKHFNKISTLLLDAHEIHYARNQPETAKQVMLSYIHHLYYLMIHRDFDSIAPIWRKAVDFFSFTEKFFTPTMHEEVIYTLALVDPVEASTRSDFWISRLETPVLATNPNKHAVQLLKNVARVHVMLPGSAHFLANQPQYFKQMLDSLHFDWLLHQMRYSPSYNFYEIMARSVQKFVNSFMNDSFNDETNQEEREIVDLIKSLTKSQQTHILRGYEYLHHKIENLQRSSDDCTTDLMLDQLETFIGACSSEESESDNSDYTYNNNDMSDDLYQFLNANSTYNVL